MVVTTALHSHQVQLDLFDFFFSLKMPKGVSMKNRYCLTGDFQVLSHLEGDMIRLICSSALRSEAEGVSLN